MRRRTGLFSTNDSVTRNFIVAGMCLLLLANAAQAQRRVRRIMSHDPTRAASGNHHPSWSPDGNRIAFDSNRDGDHEIYVMNVDGTNQVRLTDNPANDLVPTWSEDGRSIYFQSDRGEIYEVDVDDPVEPRLRPEGRPPTLSPDGSWRLAVAQTDDNLEIYLSAVDGNDRRRLTVNHSLDSTPSFSTDGSQILFQTNRDGRMAVYLMDLDGANPTRLAEGGVPDFSPDGESITFESNRYGNVEIFVMRADGTDVRRITYQSGVFAPGSATETGLPPTPEDFVELLETEGVEAAIDLMERIRAIDPLYFVVPEQRLEALGRSALTDGNVVQSLGVFELSAAVYPLSSNAHTRLGEALVRAGDRDRARQVLLRALELNADNDEAKALIEALRQLAR